MGRPGIWKNPPGSQSGRLSLGCQGFGSLPDSHQIRYFWRRFACRECRPARIAFVDFDARREHQAQFLRLVQQQIQEKVNNVGVGVQQFGFIGALRVPGVIAQAITAKAQAIQEAERAKNELATTQAEAAKKIAEAEGDAKSAVMRAQGEADANRIRQSSMTTTMLELRRLENQRALIEKWNGQLPTVESGGQNALMLQLPHQQ
jgi:regulator of protease activity HflC (stomatin/prohibitin superfamily)